MWFDQDVLQASFEHSPAYRADTKYAAAFLSNASTHISDVSSPLYFLNQKNIEFNTSLWLKSTQRGEEVGLFGNPSPTSIGELFSGNSPTGKPHYLSQHSSTLLLGLAMSNRSGEYSPTESQWRVGLSLHRQVDFQYDDSFSSFIRLADFRRNRPQPISQIGQVSLRHMAYYSLDIGRSMEITPLKTTVGANVHFLMGTDYAFARTTPTGDQMLVRRSGYELKRGFLVGNEASINGYGGSIDIGAVHRLSRQFSVHLSLLDVGLINWQNYAKDALYEDPELILGIAPLSNVFTRFDAANYQDAYSDVTSVISVDENETLGVWLDGSVRVGASIETEANSVYLMLSEGLNRRDIRPDFRQASLRYERNFFPASKDGIALGGGVDYGHDSGMSVGLLAKARYRSLNLTWSIDGLLDTQGPVNRRLMLFSLQFNLSAGHSLGRI